MEAEKQDGDNHARNADNAPSSALLSASQQKSKCVIPKEREQISRILFYESALKELIIFFFAVLFWQLVVTDKNILRREWYLLTKFLPNKPYVWKVF